MILSAILGTWQRLNRAFMKNIKYPWNGFATNAHVETSAVLMIHRFHIIIATALSNKLHINALIKY